MYPLARLSYSNSRNPIKVVTSDRLYWCSQTGVTPPAIQGGVVGTLSHEISPDICIACRFQLRHIQSRGYAELEDDGKLDVVQLFLLQPRECLGGENLIVKYEIHVNQITKEAGQFYQ